MTDSSQDDREERFDEVVADFLDAIDAGETPNEEQLIDQHPDLADSLRQFFLDHRRIGGVFDSEESSADDTDAAAAVRPDASAGSPHEQPTMAYRDAALSEPVAEQVGDYALLNEIARGGMGVVYRARQISLNRVVAVKMIRDAEFASEEEILRFKVEAEAAARLQHPGIVPIYQIDEEDGRHFFSMAFVEGRSLGQMIVDAPLHPKKAAIYVAKVAQAVHYAHEQGIIHRDLKPANVLVDMNDQPMVTDFGLAKQVAGDNELTMSGQILGTASYMPPEQAAGKTDQITAKSDVYSLGALLYALLTQRPPFTGQNPMDVLLDVLSKDPDTPSSLNIALSRDLETICMKCLEKAPNKRYESAADLAEDLERFIAGEPIHARRISRLERGLRWCKRRPFLVATICLAVTLVIGLPIATQLGRAIINITTNANENTKTDHLVRAVKDRAELAPFDPTNEKDAIYLAAAGAMLSFFQDDRATRADNFEAVARSIEGLQTVLPEDDGLRLALADCYVEIARQRRTQKNTSMLSPSEQESLSDLRGVLEKARALLDGVGAASAENAELQDRKLTIEGEIVGFLPPEERKRLLTVEQMQVALSSKPHPGLIRFDLVRWTPTDDVPSTDLREAHRLLMEGEKEGAIFEYGRSLRILKNQNRSIAGIDLRFTAADMKVLSEYQQSFIPSMLDLVWPTTAEDYYNLVLGIRLADEDQLALVSNTAATKPEAEPSVTGK